MIRTVYIEQAVRNHPSTRRILARFPEAVAIPCQRYGEVFNQTAQNFRLQKQQPALILAQKHRNFVLPTPANYGLGADHNYYFSHMMNCLYDCRYCFLQGMYRSAHYVLFVNYADFVNAIETTIANTDKPVHFFSGYDCDSLALEPVTQFLDYFLPVFEQYPDTLLEVRTKSTQIRALLDRPPTPNVVVAFSLSPPEIADALEHKAPSIERRMDAIKKLQDSGWRIGLRFDPLIYSSDYQDQYRALFEATLPICGPELLHSVSIGTFRLPKRFFKSLQKMYPNEKLFAAPLEEDNGIFSYKETIRSEMLDFCRREILNHIPDTLFFPCQDIAYDD